jgi:hypothetical protein
MTIVPSSFSMRQIRALMKTGQNIAMAVGGFEEATHFARGRYIAYVRGRQGFIKYCLRHGYAIHPIFVFGEERTLRAVTAGLSLRLMLNRLKIPGSPTVGHTHTRGRTNEDGSLSIPIRPPLAAARAESFQYLG